MKRRSHPGLAACAGLIVAPALWAVNMQAGQILPYGDCGSHRHLSAIVPLLSVLLALASGYASWRARSAPDAQDLGGQPWRFIAVLGGLVALVFAFALLLQGAAGLVLTGCER
jgi:hypothetical protein